MFKWFIDLIFPYRCIVCGKYLNHEYFCRSCFNSLPIKKQNECIGCQRPTPLGKTCTFCRDSYAVDQLLVVSDFKNPAVASTIKLFKYHFLHDLAQPLSHLSFKYLDHLAKRDHFSMAQNNPLLVPVPLHKNREYWRGFNQAELLTRLVARHYRLDVGEGLVRSIDSVPQAKLENRPERLSNVRGLYKCTKPEVFKGRHVILVDDVCTTGATLNECAHVLKNAGAVSVIALAIARG
ncbi:MAG: phosphoribosyltransferase family protein [bacterium]|nr:phosphoribosyltransferase family protein [bacterium]